MIKVNKFGFACLVAFAAVLIAAYDAAATSASSCYPRDIVMMVDESGSSKAEFNKIKALCKSIMKNFDVGTSTDDDYFALYGYTDSITNKFPFETFKNKGKLNTKNGKLSRVNTESSSLPFAVDYALKILDDQGRSSSQKVIIIVADGVLDIPSNPSTSVYDVCDNIADASELTSSSLQSCLENLVEEAVANDVVVIHVPTDNIDDADNVFTSSDILPLYVKEVSSSSDAVAESCAAISSGSTTDTASTGSPTPAPTLLSDTSCYVSNKQYTNVKKVSGIENPIKKVQTAAECGSLCYATDGCEYFTLNPKRKCFLYKSAGSSKYKKGKYFSGPKYCSRVAEEATAEPTPSPTESLTPSPTESLTPSPSESLTSSPTAPPSLANAVYDDEVFLSSTYSMSFDFTLDYTNSEGPQSIIQRGTKMNANGYVRQPALFVDEGTSKLRFRTSTSEFSNKGCNTTTELELGKTYEIKISVTEGETANLYIDGDLGCTIEYTADETLLYVDESLPLYIGCPDNFVTASGAVENLMWEYKTERPTNSPTPPTNAPTTGTPTESPTVPPSLANAVYDEEVFLSSTYSMSFDFTLDNTNSEGPQSIIQRGTRHTSKGYVRQPAVFAGRGSSKLLFRISTSVNANRHCDTTTLELGKTYQIDITVTEGDAANIYIDGDLGCSISFAASEKLLYVGESLPLYIGGPDNFVTASGTIDNLKWEYETERPTGSPTPPTNAPTTGTPMHSPTPPTNAPTTGTPTHSPTPPTNAPTTNDLGDDTLDLYESSRFLSSTYTLSFSFSYANDPTIGRVILRHGESGTFQPQVLFNSRTLAVLVGSYTDNLGVCFSGTLIEGRTYSVQVVVTNNMVLQFYIDNAKICDRSAGPYVGGGKASPVYITNDSDFTISNVKWS